MTMDELKLRIGSRGASIVRHLLISLLLLLPFAANAQEGVNLLKQFDDGSYFHYKDNGTIDNSENWTDGDFKNFCHNTPINSWDDKYIQFIINKDNNKLGCKAKFIIGIPEEAEHSSHAPSRLKFEIKDLYGNYVEYKTIDLSTKEGVDRLVGEFVLENTYIDLKNIYNKKVIEECRITALDSSSNAMEFCASEIQLVKIIDLPSHEAVDPKDGTYLFKIFDNSSTWFKKVMVVISWIPRIFRIMRMTLGCILTNRASVLR